MKVYVVLFYSDFECVFANEEDARRYCEKQNLKNNHSGYNYYEEEVQ